MDTWILWPLFGLIGVGIGIHKGLNPVAAFLGGVFLGPLSFLMFFVSSSLKKCPQCAEKVKKDAHICKHCNYSFATGQMLTK